MLIMRELDLNQVERSLTRMFVNGFMLGSPLSHVFLQSLEVRLLETPGGGHVLC